MLLYRNVYRDYFRYKVEKRLLDFKKICFLDNCTISEKTLWNKYLPYNYFKQNIKSNKIVFVSPETWRDPFEQIYFSAKNYKKYGYTKPQLFCMCLTENSSQNEDAAWSLYQNGSNEKIIKTTFNAYEMLKQLDDYCIKKNFTIYIGKVNYSFASNDISSLSKPSTPRKGKNKNHDIFFPKNFKNENYCRLLLLKRKAFEFEHEVRLFLINDNKSQFCNNYYFDDIPFKYNDYTIDTIKIAPLQPFPYNDLNRNNYNKIQRMEENIYKKEIKELLPSMAPSKIRQSALYKQKKIITL